MANPFVAEVRAVSLTHRLSCCLLWTVQRKTEILLQVYFLGIVLACDIHWFYVDDFRHMKTFMK